MPVLYLGPTTEELLDAWRDATRAAVLADRLAEVAARAAEEAEQDAVEVEEVARMAEEVAAAAEQAAARARAAARRARSAATGRRMQALPEASAVRQAAHRIEALAADEYHDAEQAARHHEEAG